MNNASSPLVAVIHANAATMPPVDSAFADVFPEAQVWHLLDDRLVKDAEREGGLTPELYARMSTLIDYAVAGGADAVQLACSMYGPVAADRAAAAGVPVLASDQAMFDRVAAQRPRRVAILASLDPAAQDSARRLEQALGGPAPAARIDAYVVAGAKEAANAGDHTTLARLLADTVRHLDNEVDVVVLAQYTLAPTATLVSTATGAPVLSGPHLAATSLATLLREPR
jgi:aspartate/glutamate racemase